MTLWPLRPRSDAIVDADKVLARIDGVVAICAPTYELTVDQDTASVVGAERVGKGAGGRREKGRRERARRALREEANACLEPERKLERRVHEQRL